MRFALLAAAAFGLAACTGGEPAKPAPEAAAAEHDMANMAGMDDTMKAADAADDANIAETPDGYMFHTDTTKVESVHLPMTPGATWIATPTDATQVQIVEEADQPMGDGSVVHHVVKVKPLTKDVIAKVKFELHENASPTSPVTQTRTVNFMVH